MEPEGQARTGPRAWGRRWRGELIAPNPKLKLLDQVREVMRLKHYSLRTERCYCDWLRRYVHFHAMRSREALFSQPEAKIEAFLSDLAVQGHVAASTQNQAFNALLFLYREILHQPLEHIQAVRADRPVRVPTVLTVEEVKQVLVAMSGTPQLVAKLLYGSGLRLLEGLRLRVKDGDFGMKQLTVRDGKGAKDRFTVLAQEVIPALQTHLQQVRLTHTEDLRQGLPSLAKGLSQEPPHKPPPPHRSSHWGQTVSAAGQSLSRSKNTSATHKRVARERSRRGSIGGQYRHQRGL